MNARTVVVTGAARGIGAGIATRFALDGWHVVLADLAPEVEATAAAIAGATGAGITAVVVDISSTDGAAAIRDALASVGNFSSLVNNAGITRDAMIKKMTPEAFNATSRVNLGGPIRLIETLAEHLVDGGTIVNISSKSSQGNVGQYNYALSKAGLLGYTRALGVQLAPRLRVNAISPGFIATEMTDAIPDDIRNNILSKIPLARPGQPSEIADVALWLSGSGSGYVTGQVIGVCGGRTYAP
jgi:NAD(P)-dependent dehydrogenase (short-subunit alcohol dehydrogenase family)